MKKFIVLASLIVCFQVDAHASVANMCLSVSQENVAEPGKFLKKVVCDITQRLTWDDNSALFRCVGSDQSKSQFFLRSVTIGSNTNGYAWTKYSAGDKAFRKGFYGMFPGMEKIEFANDIRINYNSKKAWANDKFVLVQTDKEVYRFNLKLKMNSCAN